MLARVCRAYACATCSRSSVEQQRNLVGQSSFLQIGGGMGQCGPLQGPSHRTGCGNPSMQHAVGNGVAGPSQHLGGRGTSVVVLQGRCVSLSKVWLKALAAIPPDTVAITTGTPLSMWLNVVLAVGAMPRRLWSRFLLFVMVGPNALAGTPILFVGEMIFILARTLWRRWRNCCPTFRFERLRDVISCIAKSKVHGELGWSI